MDLQLGRATAAEGSESSEAAASQPQISDVLLIDRLRSGDAVAGEVLVKRYVQPLMRYLRRIAGNDQAAEELHQQTWLSVLEHLDKFDPSTIGGGGGTGGGFKPWL